ncbi:SPOR domain-containing protein [Sphingomonas sp.]|uniref:SPOR domain-containing protein n=1 Tax=Sphingomonas sp. TaxID=28214 RepID=UPI0017E97612|nr:SPOR domain-containing protein [Sphingomonas sp.]MBA3512037.1 tetratricopeptide repeat protein [Sphingomonas sp.]
MSNPLRFGSALSAIALASVIAGCATPAGRSTTSFGGKDARGDIGLAMRALAALNDNDFATALSLAERAVEKSPNDAGFRALLGNIYFGSGRFASAQAAYRDSLALVANQPQVVLKLALVEIAQGRNGEALALLGEARGMLEPADYGLALALAGQPQEAAGLLEAAARQPGADARLRQNLALAYALSGDWDAARTIAAQDVSADLLDARIQEWMAFAKPRFASDQVAALTGVKPVAGDPGQPTRLALRGASTRSAQAAPPVQPPQQVAAYYAPPPVPEQAYAPQFDQLASAPAPEPAPAPVVEAAAPAPAMAPVPAFVETAPEFEPAYVEPKRSARPKALSASFTAKLKPARPASFNRREGNSTAVVQLGAYGSPQRVAAAWNAASRRHSVLRGYTPMSARFNSRNGLVYRLSVKGFSSPSDAKSLCESVRRAGGSCFVRSVAGDAPVRLASR